MKLPRELRAELEATGLPWTLERGSRHLHLRVGGRLAAILPYGTGASVDRAMRNTIAQIRRTVRQLKQESSHANTAS